MHVMMAVKPFRRRTIETAILIQLSSHDVLKRPGKQGVEHHLREAVSVQVGGNIPLTIQ